MHRMVAHVSGRTRLFLDPEAPVTVDGLPSQVTPLIGRAAELAELVDLLGEERVVTLTGSGGCGKTRLALEVAARLAGQFPGGHAWVELAPCSDPDGVLASVADALGVDDPPGRMTVTHIVSRLLGRGSVLLVLDNAEHVVAASAEVVAAVTKGLDNVTVVTTSREPLSVPGEVVWRVPSLGTPPLGGNAPIVAIDIDRYDSVRLFVERARRARRGFVLDDANAPAVAQICGRLDGMPLAIELAAARIRTMPADRVAAQLDDRFRLLAGGPRTLLARQQTLQASVDWSIDLLEPSERAAYRRLGVFVGGFTVAAAEAVLGGFGDIDPYDVAELVGRLVDKSLVQFDPRRERYALLETIRTDALQRLLDAGETVTARDAQAEWFATWLTATTREDVAGDLNSWWNSRLDIVERLDPEWPNCVNALDWVEPGSSRSLRLVTGLGDYWALRQRAADSARYGMPAVMAGDRDLAEWMRAVVSLQTVRTNAADAEFAVLRDEALALAVARGDERSRLRLDFARHAGMVMLFGPRADLLAAVDEACAEAARLGEWFTAWNGLQSPAVILGAAGRSREADRRVATVTSARALLIRAVGAQQRGEFGVSDVLADEAGSFLDARFGSMMDRVLATFHAAGAAMVVGDPRPLESLRLDEVVPEHLPLPLQSAFTLARAARDVVEGRLDGARDVLAAGAIDVFPSWRILCVRAQVELSLGDTQAAEEAATRVRTMLADVDAPLYATNVELVSAECQRAVDAAAALDLAHRSLGIAVDAELWPNAIDALEAIGSLLIELDRGRDGARVLGGAHAARERSGYGFRFPHRAAYVASARDRIAGDDGWSEGTSMSLEGTVELAQRMRGGRARPQTGWPSLTPTEERVVELVAAGLTNPQIAEELFMSRSTVKTHLVHVYSKLSIANRAELAAEAVRRRGSAR